MNKKSSLKKYQGATLVFSLVCLGKVNCMRYLENFIGSHLLEWNTKQKEIWLSLVSDKKVEHNDIDIFLSFSEWFSAFFERYWRYPCLEEVVLLFVKEKLY